MKRDINIPDKEPSGGLTWTDAGILAGAVLGILMGLSVFSFEVAAAGGVAVLIFVVWKLLTTQT